MFKLVICALFVTAVSASDFSKELQEIFGKYHDIKYLDIINPTHFPLVTVPFQGLLEFHEKMRLPHRPVVTNLVKKSKRESIGHQLKEQLKNVAVSSLTNSVSTVLDKALGALTEKAIGGITNLLGHIHLGKRFLNSKIKNPFIEHEHQLGEKKIKFGEMITLGKRDVFGIFQNVKDFIHKEKELLNELLHHHQTTRSTGSELKEALKGALVNSATGAINTVVNTAISGLTSAITSGLTNILGHIHLGKRETVSGNIQTMIGNFEHHLKTELSTKIRPFIEKERQYIIDEVLHQHHLARRNIFGDIGKLIGNEVKQIGAGALGSLGQLATDKLNGLISKLGRREAEDLSTAFTGVADKFSTAITDALAELPQIIAQELGPLIAQFTGSQ